MQLVEIYNLAVQKGIDADPRGKELVQKNLDKVKKDFNEMKEETKKEFDADRLANPYSDTRILFGDPDQEIRVVMSGIDIDIGEILLADRLREKGRNVDLLIAHHPEGKALAKLADVMHLQEDILFNLGVPINIAEGLLASRIKEVERAFLPMNHNKSVDAAKILGMPFMCVHTPADNMVFQFLKKTFDSKKPETVKDTVRVLKEIPEFAEAVKTGAGPRVIVGSDERRVGKIFVDMTGGTSGPKDSFEKMAQAGVGTLISMHMKEEHRKEAEKAHLNVIIAGHIASDSLGMNLFLDELEKQGVEVIPCSGLIRIKRF